MLRIGVAGLGFGRNLLNTLLPRDDCRVVAVADHFPDRMTFARDRDRGIACHADAAAMIAAGGLDAVVLASAPHVRGDGLRAALDAGLPAFVEKPLAGTLAQAREVAASCGGGRVMVGFSFRYHAPVRRLLDETASLGAPVVLNAEYLFDWLPPAENWLWDPDKGGGFFNENSCHLLDIVLALMGVPHTIAAFGADDGVRPSATAASVAIRFEGGGTAALTLGGRGTGTFADYPRLDLACADGQAKLTGRNHMWTGLRWARRGEEMRQVTAEPEGLARTRYSDAFDHFLARVADGGGFETTPADGLRAVAVADAVYRSIRSAETVAYGEE